MSKFITLVLRADTEEDIRKAREVSGDKGCVAWSMDHEILRVDLLRHAIENSDIKIAETYVNKDGIYDFKDHLN